MGGKRWERDSVAKKRIKVWRADFCPGCWRSGGVVCLLALLLL